MPNPNYEYKDGKIKVKIDGSWIEPNFERYENIKPIGEPGANGVVIKGTHKITRRDDAIKIWLPLESLPTLCPRCMIIWIQAAPPQPT